MRDISHDTPPRKSAENARLGQMAGLIVQLEDAIAKAEKTYRAKPRRARIIDDYCRVMGETHYGNLLANDVLRGRELSENAIKRLKKEIRWVEKLQRKLDDDPYVCKQPWRAAEWMQWAQSNG